MSKKSAKEYERQEKLVSALWGFAYELQHEPLEAVSVGDGTKMNMESMRRAVDVILAIFGQKRIEVQ